VANLATDKNSIPNLYALVDLDDSTHFKVGQPTSNQGEQAGLSMWTGLTIVRPHTLHGQWTRPD